jgi:hypothetical protein
MVLREAVMAGEINSPDTAALASFMSSTWTNILLPFRSAKAAALVTITTTVPNGCAGWEPEDAARGRIVFQVSRPSRKHGQCRRPGPAKGIRRITGFL